MKSEMLPRNGSSQGTEGIRRETNGFVTTDRKRHQFQLGVNQIETALASAMFAEGVSRLKELEKRMQPSSRAILGEGLRG
jgi:hypothetical protein